MVTLTDLSRGARNDVILTDVKRKVEQMTRIINMYDQRDMQTGKRHRMKNNWHNSIQGGGSTILTSDINAYSHIWHPRCRKKCHVALYDDIIDDDGLEIGNISKPKFHPGRMAPSEWTPCVRAVRGTQVADYSVPGVSSKRRIPYHPLITASPFLLILSVSKFKQSLWCCGQLWPYVGMGSLGTHCHQDCHGTGDAANISPRVPSTCAPNAILFVLIIHLIPSDQDYVAIDNPSLVPSISCLTTSSHLWNYRRAGDNLSHAENFQSNGYRCFSHWYKFRDGIQVTRVFRYCGERQG